MTSVAFRIVEDDLTGSEIQALIRLHAEAVARGYRRLSLETGRGESFAAAIRLYESAGFEVCGPFGEYEASDFSRFFTLALD